MERSYAISRFGLESKDILKSKQKGCSYYCKYFFLFTSCIEFLILIGLVLFMIYGNAHVTTEKRLNSVQELNQKYMMENKQLMSKLSSMRMERDDCYGRLQIKKLSFEDISNILQSQILQIQELNKTYTTTLKLYHTCSLEFAKLSKSCTDEKKLLQQNNKFLDTEYKNYKENCTTNMDLIKSRERQASSDRDKYQVDKIALQEEANVLKAQVDLFKSTCTSIDEKFKAELQQQKENFETRFKQFTNCGSCKYLNIETEKRIDERLMNLKQHVSATILENNLLNISKSRTEKELAQCAQDKDNMQNKWNSEIKAAYNEKELLRAEIDEMDRRLKKSIQTLNRTTSDLESKKVELLHCMMSSD
ncbi:plasmalemma vesicle-associated protein isoform X2 [Bombina bombina]|uniref:plasmalemma vesicle-associated protein isoform X2 n=1 Tax=Bombina bombina TaxID=8345 RepID=UPI00235AC7D2|nr:plasmalemma vesicle-associated protein isoform X2 [Bombina bombina]